MACIAVAVGATDAHAQTQPKIVGGSTTSIAQYPWQAAVAYDPAKFGGNPFQRQFCGGSLVTSRIVLTAGHCVHRTDPENNSDLDADDVNVVLGQTTLSTAPPSSEFDVQGVAKQAGYAESGGVPSNDVGYLVLQSPYTATTPIDIAGPDEGALWDPGSPEQITGWGATAESGPGSGGSDTLRHATVPIVGDAGCALDYGRSFNASTMVCAGFPGGGVDTCFGDSGGPMQAAIGGGVFRLVGITSWGAGCAQPDAPGVYTRVAEGAFRSAIASKVFELETTFGLPHEDVIGGAGDTDPPETSVTSGPVGPTNDSTPTFSFSSDEAGATFQCRFDSGGFGACSGPGATHTPAASLSDGAHTFEVLATDPSNNTDPTPASRRFMVDTAAPSNPALSSPSHTAGVASSDPTVDVTFTGAGDGLSGVDGFSYQWSTSPTTVPDTTKDAEEGATGTTSPSLADGSHYFHLRTGDNAGNWSATVHLGPFVIDTTVPDTDPPETSVSSGPSGPTNDSTPTFGFSSDEPSSTFECRFDAAPFGGCSGPGATHTPAAPLSDGAHVFEVRATDPSNNTDPTAASRSFSIITQAPVAPPTSLGGLSDHTPPIGRLSARLKRGRIVVEVGCDEECVANGGGVVVGNGSRFSLARASAKVPGGGAAVLKLSPKGNSARGGIRRLLASGAPAKAKIKVTLTDGGGNATAEKLVVRLRRR